jgi:hypothetical protein
MLNLVVWQVHDVNQYSLIPGLGYLVPFLRSPGINDATVFVSGSGYPPLVLDTCRVTTRLHCRTSAGNCTQTNMERWISTCPPEIFYVLWKRWTILTAKTMEGCLHLGRGLAVVRPTLTLRGFHYSVPCSPASIRGDFLLIAAGNGALS